MARTRVARYTSEHREAWVRMRRELFQGEDESLLREEERQIDASGTLKSQPFERFLAFADDVPVGFAEATIRSSAEDCMTSPVVYLEAWFVDNPDRGSGLGRSLVEAVAAWGREHGCSEMGSDARVENSASVAAHLALGFEDAGVIRCFRRTIS
ncbi:MAG: cryptic aminoglycoside N-acetyltransferase AAC(6')-Iy/Iaa [Phycisphaeraceae bacterium]|nr:MAG: cryptic aminoglycoside N-acetyltransferase AAC(6')-Iy/Iaa [Phycisphaeraceae bacterium]